MPVTLRTGSALRSLLAGDTEVQTEGETIGDLLDAVQIKDRICDAEGKVRRHFNIHVNEGEDIRFLDGLDTAVADGDSVTILSAIAGGADVSRKVWLTFPQDLVERPLIWEVGHKFAVITNIRQASVSKDVGIVGLELSGEDTEIEKAARFLEDAGVSVEPIELGVVE